MESSITSGEKRNKIANEPTVVVDLSVYGRINVVHLSKYEWCQDVILIAFPTKVMVAVISFQDSLKMDNLIELNVKSVCTAIALSPETSINGLSNIVKFCAANDDFQLCVFTTNLEMENSCEILYGHTDYINDICYDVENNYISSVSDDNTARIWSTSNNECLVTLYLSSPGISTQWHREDSKLLVAEKSGIIRFYNIHTQCPIISLDCGKMLNDVHWSPTDPQKIISLALGEMTLWDLSRPSSTFSKLVFTEYGGLVKFSPLGDYAVLVNSLEGFLKVFHVSSQQQTISAKLKMLTNTSWHFRYPLICCGDDTKLCFWKL